MSSPRPFRFGVQFSGTAARGDRTKQDWADKAIRAEALGYNIVVMPDHIGGQFAIGPALAVVAEATTTLRIGTLVLQNDLRHPALVAMEAATLDALSNGRFELGLGAGGSSMQDYESTGIPFDPPGVRVSRLEESIIIVKGLFAEHPMTFTGSHYTISELDGYPKPIQQPHPPILIGGGGRRLLSLAAREADIVSIFPTQLPGGGRFRFEESKSEGFASKIALLRQEAGDRFPDLELHVLVQQIVVTDDRTTEVGRRSAASGIPSEYWLESPQVYVGSHNEIVEQLQSFRERLGISYFVVFEQYVDDFAPVVADLAGR